jgi:hypothetical protein
MNFRQSLQRVRQYLGGRHRAGRPTKSRRLEVEHLERREAPVVGAFAVPPAVVPGTGFDGVVRLGFAGGSCSGSLLFTGRHVLTAAHCMDLDRNGQVDPGTRTVTFDMPAGRSFSLSVPAADITLAPGWNGNFQAGNDLALLRLPSIAPFGAERFNIFRGSNELYQVFTLAGYGMTGTGNTGATLAAGTKRVGQNRFDADAELLSHFPLLLNPTPPAGRALAFDFDNGSVFNDAFGVVFFQPNLGLGAAEADTAPGDSGGPSFLGGQVAGVHSFGVGFPSLPDVLPGVNSSFGEMAVDTRVSAFAGWIDATAGGSYQLVLDMAGQPAGNDGVADTIEAHRSGGSRELLELTVNGQVFHADALGRIASLTIRGSNDRDVISVDGDLGVSVSVEGRGGTNDLTVNDQNNALAQTSYQVWADHATRSNGPTVSYSGLGAVRLNAGNVGGGNTIFVFTTPAGMAVTVAAGGGGDTVHVGYNFNIGAVAGPLTVNGAGNTTVALNDQNNAAPQTSYQVWADHATRSNGPTVSYSGLGAVRLNAGNVDGGNTILVLNTPAGMAVTVNAGDGGDTVHVGYNFNIGAMAGPLTVNGAGNTTVALNDQNNTAPRTFSVTPNAVAWTGGPAVAYTRLGSLAVNGGSGNNTLVGSNAGNVWAVTGADAGTLGGPASASAVLFSQVGSLRAGTGGDYFQFADGATLSGNLTGGGSDTLDDSAYSTSVVVDLQTGQATGVGGSVSGIGTVLGGSGAPGTPGLYNLLIGSAAGGNTLTGGFGRRNLLVAGGGASTLNAGDQEDLLIGGTTLYDTEAGLGSWLQIASYWAGTDPYATRVSNLTSGGGVPLLDASTVTGNGGGNTLTGYGALALLYTDGADAISGFDPGSQTVPIAP